MRKKIYQVGIFILLFSCFSINVFAECTEDELNKLSEQANSVINNVELNEVSGVEDESSYAETYRSYLVSFYNMNTNLKLVKSGGGFVSTDEMIVGGRITFRYRSLNYEEEKFEIYSKTATCSGNLLRTMTVIIPQYNELSRDSICVEIPDYVYCAKTFFSKTNLSYEEFVAGAKKYKEQISSSVEEQKNKDNLIKFLEKYWYIFLGGIVLIGVTYIIVIKINKNREINKRGIV